MDEVNPRPRSAALVESRAERRRSTQPSARATNPAASPLQRAGRAWIPARLGTPAPLSAPESLTSEVPLCARCTALCCRYVALPIDNPETAGDFDNVRWYLMHENIHVFVDEGQWYIAFATRCKNLEADNRCGVYETRPRVCRGYDTSNCEYHGAEYRYEHLFTSADQLRRFAERELGRSMLFRPRKKKVKVMLCRDGTRKVELPIA